MIAMLAEGSEPVRTVWSELTLLVNIAGLAAICATVWLLAGMKAEIQRLGEKHTESNGDIAELRETVTELASITANHETHRQLTEERMKDVHRRLRTLEAGRRPIEDTPT